LTELLIRLFIRNPRDVKNRAVRAAYGTLGTCTGIAANVLLSALKFLAGVFSGSLAVTADAVNNLSDAAGSVMALLAVRIAEKPVDRQHPFGHGRMEYIGALAVGALIVVAGGKLLVDGVNAILTPRALTATWLTLVLLVASEGVKLWLYAYYRHIARLIDSQTLAAAAKDSLSDVFATGAVLVSIALQMAFGWHIDGYIGVLVALFVLKTGLTVCKDTVDRLLGETPNPTLTRAIHDMLLTFDGILGVHDLVVHDYGPGRCIASVHAEVSATGDIVAVHEVIDAAERALQTELGVTVIIHTDPIVTDDPAVNALRERVAACLRETDPRLTLHDFRMVPGQKKINLVFDCLLPDGFKGRDALLLRLRACVKAIDSRYDVVVQFDTDFT
jgi:cation diffusion facilitator family transporter